MNFLTHTAYQEIMPEHLIGNPVLNDKGKIIFDRYGEGERILDSQGDEILDENDKPLMHVVGELVLDKRGRPVPTRHTEDLYSAKILARDGEVLEYYECGSKDDAIAWVDSVSENYLIPEGEEA